MRAPALTCLLLLAAHLPAPAHAQDTTRVTRRFSWTTDRPRIGMGDIVTVLIDERALASATLRDNAGDNRDRGLSVNAALAGTINQSGAINSNNNADTRRNGEQMRQSTFNSEVSARVVEVSRSGMLRVEGEKELRVDRARQTVTISGWLRPNDIAAASNTVESWRLADARVRYQQQGNLGKPKRGLIMSILGLLWP